MEERLGFVARLLEGEGMSEVCRDFGISRKTGYKIFNRYKADGLEALTDRSRRPVRYANQLPAQVEALIVTSKKNKPHWGARKIRELAGAQTRWRRAHPLDKHDPRHPGSPRAGHSCPTSSGASISRASSSWATVDTVTL